MAKLVGKIAGAVIAVHLAVQVVLPFAILARPGSRPRDFSWDMFSHRLSCSKLEVVARTKGGPWEGVRLDLDFVNWAQLSRVLLPGRLEAYCLDLCRKLKEEEHSSIELRLITECREDRDGPSFPVADPARDYCLGSP